MNSHQILSQLDKLQTPLESYFGGERQTRSSVAAVQKYEQAGYKAIGPQLHHVVKGDEIFIFGSGPTVNDLDPADWDFISRRGSVAFNNFITHRFVPDFYFVQANRVPRFISDFERCYRARREQYKDATFVGRGDIVNKFEFHLDPGCAEILNDAKERFYFAPELFVHSRAKVNPRRMLRELIEHGVLRHGTMASILPKFGATIPTLHIFAALLGYKKIIFCGVDMFDRSHFYDTQYGTDVIARFEHETPPAEAAHPHSSPTREFSIRRILADQARELYRAWGVETYCTSEKSLLHPSLPRYEFPKKAVVPSPSRRPPAKGPLRIAMLTASFLPKLGGAEIQMHTLATKLSERGHDVTVFAPRARQASGHQASAPYRLFRYAPRLSHDPFLNSPRQTPLSSGPNSLPVVFREEHLRDPFDVISSHSAYRVSSMALALRDLFDVPVVTRCHGIDIKREHALGYGWRLDPIKDAVISDAIRRSDRCVAISEDVAEELSQITRKEDIRLISNGIDVGSFSPGRSRIIHGKFHLADDAVVALLAGRNVEKKKFALALRALAEIRQQCPALHFTFVGSGCEPLLDLARELSIDGRVHIVGEVATTEMPEYYRSADLFVMPSVSETFGAVTAEAMASGLPVVAADAPGTRDQVINGKTGLLVAPDNSAELARGIQTLYDSADLRQQFGLSGRERAVDLFSWDRIVLSYEALYQEVAAQPYHAVVGKEQDVPLEVEAFDRGHIRFTRHAGLLAKSGYSRLKLSALERFGL